MSLRAKFIAWNTQAAMKIRLCNTIIDEVLTKPSLSWLNLRVTIPLIDRNVIAKKNRVNPIMTRHPVIVEKISASLKSVIVVFI